MWFEELSISGKVKTADPYASIECYKVICCGCCCCHHYNYTSGHYWDGRRGLTIYIHQDHCHPCRFPVIILLIENNVSRTGVDLPVLLESVDIRIEGPIKVKKVFYIGPFRDWRIWRDFKCCDFKNLTTQPPLVLNPDERLIVVYMLKSIRYHDATIDIYVRSGFVK
ncbi:MAG: hypothetical protein J7K21_07640 [Desulfurococcales archaeon]|nr:hypothetical protein [Desulfurococcales archaeon]